MAVATHVIITDTDSPFERAARVGATVQVIAEPLNTTPAWVQVYFSVVLENIPEGALGLSAVFLSDDYGVSDILNLPLYSGASPTEALTLAESGTQIEFITMNGKGPFTLSRNPSSYVNLQAVTNIMKVFDDGSIKYASTSILQLSGRKITPDADNYGVSGIVQAEYSYSDSIRYADGWLTPNATGMLKPASGSVFWALSLDGVLVTSGQQTIGVTEIPPLGATETATGIITTIGPGDWSNLRISPLSGY